MMQSIRSFFFMPSGSPGASQDNPLDVYAVPGLMTLLDVALYRAVEGELTATLQCSHMLLQAWLDLKQQAISVLQQVKHGTEPTTTTTTGGGGTRRYQMESFARACLEAACDATERFTVDKLAQSANMSDPFESSAMTSSTGSSQQVILQQSSLEESFQDTARRVPLSQRPRDCWESPRLHCPDYVWGDDAASTCQRLLRHLYKHPFSTMMDNESTTAPFGIHAHETSTPQRLQWTLEQQAQILCQLIQIDIPGRLVQFRTALEADSVVSKRLYLVKCEYRAPFRAFLEAHQSVLRAPSLELVTEQMSLARTKQCRRRDSTKEGMAALLANTDFVEALALEQKCEEYEIEMAKALFPFCELARYLEHKRARLKVLPSVLDEKNIFDLQDTLRRLKGNVCRKSGPDTSTGIRPLLLDLQGVPRDEDVNTVRGTDHDSMLMRLESFLDELRVLGRLCETKNAFQIERKGDVEVPSSIVRGCTQFDSELFSCHFQDWIAMVERQHVVTADTDFEELAEKLRLAEMQMSLAVAPVASLEVVRERVEMITADRSKRLDVLKEMIEEVCLREMNLHVRVNAPHVSQTLVLQPTSALGVFGLAMEMAGETLPIG